MLLLLLLAFAKTPSISHLQHPSARPARFSAKLLPARDHRARTPPHTGGWRDNAISLYRNDIYCRTTRLGRRRSPSLLHVCLETVHFCKPIPVIIRVCVNAVQLISVQLNNYTHGTAVLLLSVCMS